MWFIRLIDENLLYLTKKIIIGEIKLVPYGTHDIEYIVPFRAQWVVKKLQSSTMVISIQVIYYF